MTKEKKIYGAAALFNTPDEIVHAAEKARDAGYKKFDIHTPYPLHGMDKAMGLPPSKVGFLTLFFGFSGTAFILLFIYYAMSIDYPMVIGGKPYFSLPAFVPVTFEFTVLLGALATAFGMLAAFAHLPNNNHPLHDTDYMKAVSSDKYGLVIEAEDEKFKENETVDFLKNIHPFSTELIYHPEREEYSIFNPKFVLFLAVTALLVSGLTYVSLNKLLYITPFDWMMEQDKVIPQERSEFYSDEFGMRQPVEGTVARGFLPYPFTGIAEPENYLPNPLMATKEVMKLGEEKFLTFCSPCHGNYAEGDSRLQGQFPNPPTLHSTRGREMSDGQLYHIIVNGQNVMPSYAPQTTEEERWAIVHYIRALQRAKNASQSDIQFAKEKGDNVQE